VGESVDKGLAAEALPAPQLDKPEAATIDHAARPQRLDSGRLQNYLGGQGFSTAPGGLWRGPAAIKEPFRRPALDRAEEGLLHVMGVLRERDEVRTGYGFGARRLQHSLHLCRLDGAVVQSDIERSVASSRPKKIGMILPVRVAGVRVAGLAEA
jgi:hypothetical protein